MQLVIGTLLSAAFLLFQVQASPYINMTDDLFASAVSFFLVVVFLVSASFKYSSLIDLKDIQSKMSNEQTDLYILDHLQLTGIIIGAVYSALMVSGSIFTVQFAAEGARRQREALASKARRLRFVNTRSKLRRRMSRASITCFSATWGTGQDQIRIVKQKLLEMIPGYAFSLSAPPELKLTNLT